MLVINRRNLFVWSANIFLYQDSQRVTHGGSIVGAVVDPYHDLKIVGNEKEGGGGVTNDRNWPQTTAIDEVSLPYTFAVVFDFLFRPSKAK
jgi:hypothetical protein